VYERASFSTKSPQQFLLGASLYRYPIKGSFEEQLRGTGATDFELSFRRIALMKFQLCEVE
jgi:hypothetical protein